MIQLKIKSVFSSLIASSGLSVGLTKSTFKLYHIIVYRSLAKFQSVDLYVRSAALFLLHYTVSYTYDL